MASAHAIIGLIFPIIVIIVRFCVAAWLNLNRDLARGLRAADHETIGLRGTGLTSRVPEPPMATASGLYSCRFLPIWNLALL